MPNVGETYIGPLRSRGMRVQRWLIREAKLTVDPVSRALRQCQAVVRRTYNVSCPNAVLQDKFKFFHDYLDPGDNPGYPHRKIYGATVCKQITL